MTNEEFVRQAYALAEVRDLEGWVACFNPDGVFVDDAGARPVLWVGSNHGASIIKVEPLD